MKVILAIFAALVLAAVVAIAMDLRKIQRKP